MTTTTKIVLAGAGLSVFAVARYVYVQKKLLNEIYVKPSGGNIIKLGNDNIELNVKYTIVNPSDIEALCTKVFLNVMIGAVVVANIESLNPIVVKARSETPSEAKVTIDKKSIEDQVFGSLLNILNMKLAVSLS